MIWGQSSVPVKVITIGCVFIASCLELFLLCVYVYRHCVYLYAVCVCLCVCSCDVRDHTVNWGEQFDFHCKIYGSPVTGELEPCCCKVSIRKVSVLLGL